MSDPSPQTIHVHSELDVIKARRLVRDLARNLGMNLADQSRVSLATSSLANTLELGRTGVESDQITIHNMNNGERRGIKVVCVRFNCPDFKPLNSFFGNERWMVDELDTKIVPPDSVEVTITKWVV